MGIFKVNKKLLFSPDISDVDSAFSIGKLLPQNGNSTLEKEDTSDPSHDTLKVCKILLRIQICIIHCQLCLIISIIF